MKLLLILFLSTFAIASAYFILPKYPPISYNEYVTEKLLKSINNLNSKKQNYLPVNYYEDLSSFNDDRFDNEIINSKKRFELFSHM
uniref:Neuropeptide n=1 Tax=Parastrongyloides trichosuri TaxID=131310 RepID=A0A0N4ZDR7_PARTI